MITAFGVWCVDFGVTCRGAPWLGSVASSPARCDAGSLSSSSNIVRRAWIFGGYADNIADITAGVIGRLPNVLVRIPTPVISFVASALGDSLASNLGDRGLDVGSFTCPARL